MLDKPENVKRFKKLLPRGAQAQIARKLGITEATVSQTIDKLNPSSLVVQEAVRIAQANQEGPAAETAKILAALLNNSGPDPVLSAE